MKTLKENLINHSSVFGYKNFRMKSNKSIADQT